MIKYRYILFYSKRLHTFRIAKIKAEQFNFGHPRVLWVFPPEQLRLGLRICRNMNRANDTDASPYRMAS